MEKRELIEVEISIAGEENQTLEGHALLMAMEHDKSVALAVVGKMADRGTRIRLLSSVVAGTLHATKDAEDFLPLVITGVIAGFVKHAKQNGMSDEQVKVMEDLLAEQFDVSRSTTQDDVQEEV